LEKGISSKQVQAPEMKKSFININPVFWAEEDFLYMYIEVRMLWREGVGIREYHLMN
jgi:hypothetical protein